MSPYISKSQRPRIDDALAEFIGAVEIDTPGKLNYIFTKLALAYLRFQGQVGYTEMNEVVGVFETAKMEWIRRVLTPYEEKRKTVEGDVFD